MKKENMMINMLKLCFVFVAATFHTASFGMDEMNENNYIKQQIVIAQY